MSATTPIREKNAIDEIAFVILFEKELDNKTLTKLLDLKDELSSELPHFQVQNAVQIMVDPQNTRMHDPKPAGVFCAKRSEQDAKRMEWSLRVEVNRIIVTCSEYTNWQEVKTRALVFLAAALDKFDLNENLVVEIVLQCVDKFVYNGAPDQYRVSEVFNIESADFLTLHIAQKNPDVWHIHQGWFSDHEHMQVLNNLNLNSHKPNDQVAHETVISHLVKIRKPDGSNVCDKDLLSANGQQVGYLESAMEVAHDLNKQVLLNLLNGDMSEAIGLKN